MATATQNPTLNLNLVLEQVAKDKGIEKSVLVATLEDAMKTAAKKHFGQDRNLEAKYDTRRAWWSCSRPSPWWSRSPTRSRR